MATLKWLLLVLMFGACVVGYIGPRYRPDDYRWDTEHCDFYPWPGIHGDGAEIYCITEGYWVHRHGDHRPDYWEYIGR